LAAFIQKLIERGLYQKISGSVPIVCVDLLILNRDKKLLLVKRRNHPLKGHWWVVGGRILLGETPTDAAYRKAKEEVGLELVKPSRFGCRFIGYYSDIYRENAFGKMRCQTISLVYRCRSETETVRLDEQSSAYRWADAMPSRIASKLMT